jgi:uncharacterized damage-inducible protein DinB
MARVLDLFLEELDHESQTTRKVLERVPEEKLSWKPHQKSMSLGELGTHVATIPGALAQAMQNDVLDVGVASHPAPATSRAELISAFENSLMTAKRVIGGFDDQKAMGIWKIVNQGKDLLALPRVAAVRGVILNHLYHHRGQLTVYLRLLNVPVPPIYGPSADERLPGM